MRIQSHIHGISPTILLQRGGGIINILSLWQQSVDPTTAEVNQANSKF